jgi:hypothetical protein
MASRGIANKRAGEASMKFDKVQEIYNSCKQNEHYQYKNLSNEEWRAKADTSFNKLTEQQKSLIATRWRDFLVANGQEVSPENLRLAVDYRFLFQTNLYSLCHLLEKYNQVTVRTHEEICNSFFVRKDPTYISFEAFANQYTDLKERMLLTPRGSFKSSCGMVDIIQWILCFPAITILMLTGVYKLASDFVGEIKQHFTLDENGVDSKGKPTYGPRKIQDKETGEWSTSAFQVLFAEHSVKPSDGTQFEFDSPAGGDAREPSVRAASIEQSLSGMHFCILCLDDVITNENSMTVDRMVNVNKQISVNKALLHSYGFCMYLGTWYHDLDFYGEALKQEENFAKEEGLLNNIQGSINSGRFNSSVFMKVHLRAAWWPTEEARLAGKIEEEMQKSDWELFFPEP